jgi:drug/metabolite transporter (DMT)-like permease
LSSFTRAGKGVALVTISGICWGFHGVMIKYAIGLGASFMQVLLVEVSFAFVFFAFFGPRFLKKVRPQGFLQWFRLILIGLATIGVGYFLFLSYSLGPVAIPATLMFLYLPIVYGFSIFTKNQRFSLIKSTAIVSVLLGAILTTQIFSTFHQANAFASVIAASCASMCYAIVFILTPGVAAYTSAEFRAFTVSGIGLLGCILILQSAPSLWYDLGDNAVKFYIFALLLGVVGQALPVISLMKGLPLTGSSLGGVVASIELPIAVLSAFILLGESLAVVKIFGVLLVLLGIVIYNFAEKLRLGR